MYGNPPFLRIFEKYKWNVGIVHGTMGNEKFEFNGGIIMCGMTTDL